MHVANTKTQVVHRIGTTIEEAGLHARTLCGWRYAAKGQLSVDAPNSAEEDLRYLLTRFAGVFAEARVSGLVTLSPHKFD